jgi:hypothetical protein
MDGGLRAGDLLRRPVCFRDIRLGVVSDVVFDEPLQRAIGLDVLCGDRNHRFLPLGACELRHDAVAVDSALVLMSQELEFYRARGRSLTALRGQAVRRGATELGTLADVELESGGVLSAVFLAGDGPAAVSATARLTIGPNSLRRAV